jgi:hypothetical protein
MNVGGSDSTSTSGVERNLRSAATGIAAAAYFVAEPAPRRMTRLEATALDAGRGFLGRHLVASEKGGHARFSDGIVSLSKEEAAGREAPVSAIQLPSYTFNHLEIR